MTGTCTVCRATVVISRELTDAERPTFMCEQCHFDLMMSDGDTAAFQKFELPKFKMLIQDFEHGVYTVEEFYARMNELVEPF